MLGPESYWEHWLMSGSSVTSDESLNLSQTVKWDNDIDRSWCTGLVRIKHDNTCERLFISSIMLLRCEGLLFLYAQEGWQACCPRWLKSICDFICPNNFILISTCPVYYMGTHKAQNIYSFLATVTMAPLTKLTLVKTSKTKKGKRKGGGGVRHYSWAEFSGGLTCHFEMTCTWWWTADSADQMTPKTHGSIDRSPLFLSFPLIFPVVP